MSSNCTEHLEGYVAEPIEGHIVGSPSHKAFIERREEERDRREAERAEAFIHGGPLKARKRVKA